MISEGSQQRELQEKSIKARKHELFVGEVNDVGPQKTFRQVLRETPAAPMTRNVKLILLSTTAPVLLLFVAALHAAGNTSRAKAPEVPILLNQVKVKPTQVVKATPDQPASPAATEAKPDEPKPEAKPKPVAKKGKKTKKKAKAKDNPPVVAENTEAEDSPKTASTDESKPKSKSKSKSKPDANSDSDSDSDSKSKDSKGKPSMSGSGSTPDKPQKRTTSVFKRPPKPPNYAYPKRGSDKKDENPGTDPSTP